MRIPVSSEPISCPFLPWPSVAVREEVPGRITSDPGARAVGCGAGRLQISPGVWAVSLFAFSCYFLLVVTSNRGSVMFVPELESWSSAIEGPPSLKFHTAVKPSFSLVTALFSIVSDQDNGVLQRAIVVVGRTGHEVPVHSGPTSE